MHALMVRILVSFLLMLSFSSCGQNDDENKIEEIVEIVPDNLYPSSELIISTHSDWTRGHYPERINEFKEHPLETNDLVFLGNSITEQGGDWSLKVNNPKAKNRGIAGDTTEGVLARLAELSYYKPEKIFLLIGINDLFHDSMTPAKVYEDIIEITNQLSVGSPETEIFVQTVLPTTTESLINEIKSINTLLENSEATHPYQLIKLHQHFVLQNGKMNMDFSTDGVHLNEKGYQIWTEILINFI
jgi:hypothetical protein